MQFTSSSSCTCKESQCCFFKEDSETGDCFCTTCSAGYYLSSGICNSCPYRCSTCIDGNICKSCKEGYYLSGIVCDLCSSSCKTCEETDSKCTSCKSKYYLSSNKCINCNSPCEECTSSTVCTSCIEGYYLSSNKCNPCVSPCKKCSSETACTSCIDGYFLLSNNCYQCNVNCKSTDSDDCKCLTCNDGYYLYNSQCLECDTSCKTCSGSATSCSECNEGFFLTSSGTCVTCTESCKICLNETTCETCLENYFLLSNECYECNVNCKTSNDNCKCDICEDGLFLSNYQCHSCDNNCKTCKDNASNCISCHDGFYLTPDNSCASCSESCKICSSGTKCLSCVDNYFLYSGKCYQCNFNCKISLDNCRCIACNIGYYFHNFQCLSCDLNCKTCKNKANYCTSCKEDKYLNENSCLNCNGSCNNTENNNTQIDEEVKLYDEIIENINSYFTSEFYETSNIDNSDDEMFELEKIKIILTSTKNQKKYENENITSINLGQCEILLKSFYNITDDKLYIKKMEVKQDYMKIPKIEYAIYSKLNGTNLVQLNLSICENSNSRISLLIPLEITEDLDKLNSRSDYFNSICYPSTSEDGTDIPLNDRQKEYKEQNKTICQDGCYLSNYDYATKKVNCSCQAKESPLSFADMKINTTELYKNFVDIKNIININILICFNNLFSKDGIIYNVGSFIIIAIIIFHIICIFIFYFKQFKVLKKKIKDISFAIKNFKDKNYLKKEKKKKKGKNKVNITKYQKGNKKQKNSNKSKNILTNDENKDNIRTIQIGDNTKKMDSNSIIATENPNKNNKRSNKIYNNISNQKHKIKKIKDKKDKSNKRSKSKKEIRKKVMKTLDYIDAEKNDFPYDLAINYDKRKYFQFYISLLKTQHEFICVFFQGDDYNSRIIKIDFFFVSFTVFYSINGLFFDDDTMHKIYESKGSFDLEYQIPKIVYSSLISIVINKILGLLALSNNALIKFKENKEKKDVNKRKKNLIKNLNIKFPIYFILSFLFLVAFWYYIAMFGAIYKNTQMHLLEDTLISFGLSLLYPFIIYLFPGIFRIPALSGKKKKRKCLYDFSKIIQMF